MMIQEFEALTGFYPDSLLFDIINKRYSEQNEDKATFCKAYKKNKDGLAEGIQREAIFAAAGELSAKDPEIRELKAEIEALRKKLEATEAKLEAAEEWKDHEDEHNVKQRQYEELSDGGNTRELDDAEAIELISKEWGFAPQMIRIVRTVAKEQINRFHRCRRVGEYERKPLYNATDWNYIRFDVAAPHGTMSYEMHNGELQFFFH